MDTPAAAIGGGLLHDEAGLRAAHREHAGELFRFARRQLGDTGAADTEYPTRFVIRSSTAVPPVDTAPLH